MSELWNLWEVNPPPLCTVKTSLHLKEVNNLKQTVFDAVRTLRNVRVLDREAANLSRFLYKHKRIFRHDKGMQNLVKVNQCLKRYLKLDMKGVLMDFQEGLGDDLAARATHAYLPTKQMLKWVLLRLQAFSQIFARILNLTKQTGAYIYQKLFLGWALKFSLVLFCMTARIMVLSKFLVMKSMDWYGSLYKLLPFLKETAEFLPGYEFPADLKLWQEPVDLAPLKKKTLIDKVFDIIDLTGEGDDEDSDNEIQIVSEKLIKLFKENFQPDSDIEEITVEEEKKEEEEEGRGGVKRSSVAVLVEDVGIPVAEEEVVYVPKEKKRRPSEGGERLKGGNGRGDHRRNKHWSCRFGGSSRQSKR